MKLAAPLLAATISVTACASTSQTEQAGGAYDPFEGWNRGVYAFNETVDKAALEPSARAYRAFTPGFFREGVRNFLSNLRQPVVFANTVLQGNADASTATAGRFLINSTVGVAGVFDVASTLGMEKHNEDFGQTLAVWGVEDGPYIMLPILGPSNLRDGTGRFVDRYPHPLNWNTEYSESTWAWSLRGLNGLDTRARAQGVFATMETTAIDPYVQVRSAYRQLRAEQIGKAGQDTFDDLPDFDAGYDDNN